MWTNPTKKLVLFQHSNDATNDDHCNEINKGEKVIVIKIIRWVWLNLSEHERKFYIFDSIPKIGSTVEISANLMKCEISRPFQASKSHISLLRIHLYRPTSIGDIEFDRIQEVCAKDYIIVFDCRSCGKCSRWPEVLPVLRWSAPIRVNPIEVSIRS
jgi:hypothetical protein